MGVCYRTLVFVVLYFLFCPDVTYKKEDSNRLVKMPPKWLQICKDNESIHG